MKLEIGDTVFHSKHGCGIVEDVFMHSALVRFRYSTDYGARTEMAMVPHNELHKEKD